MNKTILITGASSGIGHSLSLKFAQNGWQVIAAARRIRLLNSLSKQIKNNKAIKPIKIDITDDKLLSSSISKIIKKYGVPNIIFLNAGTNNPNSNHIVSMEELRKIFEINFFGTINCVSKFLPHIKNKKNIQIIIMSSVAGYRGLPYAAAYCSSKSAVTTYAEAIHAQCNQFGIKIRVVNPGFIKTPLTDKNEFPMPMIMSSEKAADILFKKFIKSKSFEINLPFMFCFIMKILKILPNKLYLNITKLMIKKL